MILFSFATQATEPAPGASIEEPRLLLDGVFTNRKHKQTQEEPRVPHTNLVAYPRCRPMGGC